MGTASFSVGRRSTGGDGNAMDSSVATSGAFTTSTTAAFIEDASGDIVMALGQILRIHADEAMRIRFGSVAATASTGHYIPAGVQTEFECSEYGKVSIIDVA